VLFVDLYLLVAVIAMRHSNDGFTRHNVSLFSDSKTRKPYYSIQFTAATVKSVYGIPLRNVDWAGPRFARSANAISMDGERHAIAGVMMNVHSQVGYDA